MSDFSAEETHDRDPNVADSMELESSSSTRFNSGHTDHSTVPDHAAKRRKTVFSPEELEILNELWGKGMKQYGTPESKRLLEQAVTYTGKDVGTIKRWIDNKKGSTRKTVGGKKQQKQQKPTMRQRTAHNIFLSQRLSEGIPLPQAHLEYKTLKRENGDALRLLQAEAKQAKAITIQELSDKDKRLQAQTLIKNLKEMACKFKECGLEMAVLLFHKEDGVSVIGTPKGRDFLKDQDEKSALSLQFVKAVNDGNVPLPPASASSKSQLAKEVRSMLNEKYVAAGNKGKFPYKTYSAEEGGITVHGLPEGTSVRHIASLGKEGLQRILQEQDKITVEVHSTPANSTSTAGTSSTTGATSTSSEPAPQTPAAVPNPSSPGASSTSARRATAPHPGPEEILLAIQDGIVLPLEDNAADNEPGHIQRDCPNVRRCYVCGDAAHIQRDCPWGGQGSNRYNPQPDQRSVPKLVRPAAEGPGAREESVAGCESQRSSVVRDSDTCSSPTLESVKSRTIGSCDVVDVDFEGVTVPCLLDTGSQVTTITYSFFKSHFGDSGERIKDASSWLKLTGANGLPIKFVGYCELDVLFRGKTLPKRGVIIVEDGCRRTAPGILGMNVIGEFQNEENEQGGNIQSGNSKVWQKAIRAARRQANFAREDGRVGYARASGRRQIIVPAGHEMIVYGRARPGPDNRPYQVLVEPPDAGCLPAPILVARAYAEVRGGRVPIRLANVGKQDVHISQRARLGILYLAELQSQGTVELEATGEQEVHVNFIQCNVNSEEQTPLSSPPPTRSKPDSGPDPDVYSKVDLDGADLTPEQEAKLEALLQKHSSVFSTHKHDFGYTETIKHRIPTGDTPPIRQPYRSIPPNLYKEVKQHVQDMLDQEVIRESCSPWASPVVLVRKKDGDLRFCVDYRRVNAKTHHDAFPLPRIEESLSALQGAAIFSTLDLASGYWQVAVDEEDKEKTAFSTQFGLFEFNRLPFGLSGAPASFQRLMQHCLGDQNLETLLIYLDDIIVFSSDFDDHLARLDLVFTRLRAHGLKLRPDKCHLFKRRVKYLGHVVSEKEVATDPDKCAVLRDWPEPKTVKQVKSFLGFCSYYRRFVKDFAKIAHPLQKLTVGQAGKGKGRRQSAPPFSWSPECQKAFDTLKKCLMSADILAYPDFQLPFTLYIDASHDGLGAVLSQEQKGVERVIAYASRGLRPAERNMSNYSSFKLELLGLKWAVTDKFKDYLYGAKCTVFTDNNPLAHLGTAQLGAVEQRWAASLANFDFDVKYRPGKSNVNADVLSRLPAYKGNSYDKVEVVTAEVAKICCENYVAPPSEPLSVTLAEIAGASPFEPMQTLPGFSQADLAQQQRDDPILDRVIHFVGRGRKPDRREREGEHREVNRILGQWDRLELRNGILYRRSFSRKADQAVKQAVLPVALRKDVFTQVHSRSGHLGVPRILELLRNRVYWPNMEGDIRVWVQSCERCCLRKTSPPNNKSPLVSISTKAPLELVAMDYLKVDKASSGHQYILVITDHFTKFTVSVPTRDQTAETTAKALWSKFIMPYGFPQRLHSDQGANFLSATIQGLCRLYGGAKSRTTPYHPAGNGQWERVLIRNKRIRGPSKLKDQWEQIPHVVDRQPNAEIPVYVVTPERGGGPSRTLHRDMLTPCMFAPRPGNARRPRAVQRDERAEGREPEESESDNDSEGREDVPPIVVVQTPVAPPEGNDGPDDPRYPVRENRGVPPIRYAEVFRQANVEKPKAWLKSVPQRASGSTWVIEAWRWRGHFPPRHPIPEERPVRVTTLTGTPEATPSSPGNLRPRTGATAAGRSCPLQRHGGGEEHSLEPPPGKQPRRALRDEAEGRETSSRDESCDDQVTPESVDMKRRFHGHEL
ncbi:hypothetical protein Bbelb_035160 [Branchiostoma belcheri]|nr:hypothetical protein Bbelb_035160 [Branchiostoma belcheri]